MNILIGTCGWSAKGGRKEYFRHFSVIEIQETFYKIPKEDTVRRWREEAPQDFEYTIKAWQGITHPVSSPTWRKSNIKPKPGKESNYGFFRPTQEVFDAWKGIRRIALILKASVVVFQTPPSFKFSKENLSNIERFFSSIDRKDIVLAWEPRGDWNEHKEELSMLLSRFDLIHVVDPLKRLPLSTHEIVYFRLHGLGKKEVNYRYKYTDQDLKKLCKVIKRYTNEVKKVYVFFNNIYMFDDSLRFKEVLKHELGK